MNEQERLQELLAGHYQLQWVIGTGGMSTVYLADDLRHQREVAIKVLRPEFASNPEFLSRFRNEAAASTRINSDHVVRTYDYLELREPHSQQILSVLIMEYVRGETLSDLLQRRSGPLEEGEALDILEQAAQGLATIHGLGLVHRDIKPGNLLITQNKRVKIADFGIAKAAASAPLTRTGMVVGTAQYVSPEQAQGLVVDTASDIYSLGVVGYEMLAGRRPFEGDSTVSVALAHINQAPPALPTTISAPAREVIATALRKEPSHRYRDGREYAQAISAARLGRRPAPVSAPPTTRIISPPQPASTSIMPPTQMARTSYEVPPAPERSGWITGVILVVVFGGVVALGFFLYRSGIIDELMQPSPPVQPSIVTVVPEEVVTVPAPEDIDTPAPPTEVEPEREDITEAPVIPDTPPTMVLPEPAQPIPADTPTVEIPAPPVDQSTQGEAQ
ncbi:protein kinase [Corynebacterium sp. ES2794-CONJ1]|uniref:protein kinase domain-containing protein n=1 Tax=unclassified Corynebacterium TaxID=2624378 RepID=UPI0021678268|nr:protein kinase [Corynebacterium sp. ES2775-CONJ]MCU9519722.1 protein kinase [Corynebacterium sp. ES2794-CONJ1]